MWGIKISTSEKYVITLRCEECTITLLVSKQLKLLKTYKTFVINDIFEDNAYILVTQHSCIYCICAYTTTVSVPEYSKEDLKNRASTEYGIL